MTRAATVFAATELVAVACNPNIDHPTRDMLAHCRRCVRHSRAAIDVGFIAS